MLAALAPHCAELILTQAANPRAVPADALLGAALPGGPPARVIAAPHAALRAARAVAGDRGVVLVTGSLYLLADLLRPEGAPRGSVL